MSLQYLLDGYNLVHQMPMSPRQTFEDYRRQLIQSILRHAPQGSRNNKVTVVFDGRSDVFGGMESWGQVEVVFSQDETADDKIKRMVECAGNKRNIVVVTDDRDVQYAVRALGAKCEGVREFLSRIRPSNSAQKASGGNRKTMRGNGDVLNRAEEKRISKTVEFKISSEMEKIWLKPES